MCSHDSFEYLKHKLWAKEKLGVKVSIWLPPIKSKNRPKIRVWKWRATYRWKVLHKNYKFVLELISINFHKKLWPPKIQESQFESLRTKWHLDVATMANHIKYYKGEGGGFPKSRPWWVLWVHVCPWFVHALKMFWPCTNQLVVWVVLGRVNNWPTSHLS
jgi:hypothetical protein